MAKTQAESDLQNPEEAFAWMFAAGIPDPRGEQYRNQPLIPPMCFGALSKMLWDMGCRFHPELQTKWVGPRSGPTRNFEAWGTTDSPEQMANFMQEASPETAEAVAKVKTPEEAQQLHDELQKKVADGMARIQDLTTRFGGA